MPRTDAGVVKRGIVIPDQHLELVDWPAYRVACRAVEIIKPDFFVNLGDVGEWEWASHWKNDNKRNYAPRRPPLEYQLDGLDQNIITVNARMDIMDEKLDKVRVKNKYITEGNHDDWLNHLVKENPMLERTSNPGGRGYLFKDAVRLKQRGYEYHPCGEYMKIGKLHFYHGIHYATVNHTRNHLHRLGCNIMYADKHDIQHSYTTQMGGPIGAWCIGCLKDLSPEANEFNRKKLHNWGHAFAVVDFFGDGMFTVHVVQIVFGKASLWGELIDGNKQEKAKGRRKKAA